MSGFTDMFPSSTLFQQQPSSNPDHIYGLGLSTVSTPTTHSDPNPLSEFLNNGVFEDWITRAGSGRDGEGRGRGPSRRGSLSGGEGVGLGDWGGEGGGERR